MPTFGVKVTRIPNSVDDNKFRTFLFSLRLRCFCSFFLKNGDKFKHAFVNFSSLLDAQTGVDIINGTEKLLEGVKLVAKLQKDRSTCGTTTTTISSSDIFPKLDNGIKICHSKQFHLDHLKEQPVDDELPDYVDDDEEIKCKRVKDSCHSKVSIKPHEPPFSFKVSPTQESSQSSSSGGSIILPQKRSVSDREVPHDQQQLPSSLCITKSVEVSHFFTRKSKLLCHPVPKKLTVNPTCNNTKIVLTGEKLHVDCLSKKLEEEFVEYKSKLITKSNKLEALYAPLFLQKSVIENIKEVMTEHCIDFHILRSTNISLTVDQLHQQLCEKTNSELLLLKDLNELQLLTHSDPKQWYIQRMNGEWAMVPSQTNTLFNCLKSPYAEIEESGIKYKVDLHNKTAVNTSNGFTHNLSVGVLATWYRDQDDEFGFVPFDSAESSFIEECYKSHTVKPQTCGGSRCYYNFLSMVEIDTKNKLVRKIKREPSSQLNTFPTMTFTLQGIESDLELALSNFDKLLKNHIVSISPPSYSNTHSIKLFECYAQQYCMKTTPSVVCLQGVKHYVNEALLQIFRDMDQCSEVTFSVPDEWEMPQEDNIVVIPVKKGTNEWSNIEKRWKETLPATPIIKIERIQNRWLWNHYCLSRTRIRDKNNGEDNELWLFHGTSSTSPSDIYRSEKGFDFRYSRPGLWGNGTYFATNASYSLKYAYRNKQMFLARVITGSVASRDRDRTLKMPPLKGNGDRYDCVKGCSGGSDIYIVYDHDKAYPAYLITF